MDKGKIASLRGYKTQNFSVIDDKTAIIGKSMYLGMIKRLVINVHSCVGGNFH